MKTKIDIEKLLKWAYCEELPKEGDGGARRSGSGSGWQSVNSYAELLTRIDDNKYGVVPDFGARVGNPHADAIRVHEAVSGLASVEFALGDDWNPMPEIAEHAIPCSQALNAARFGLDKALRRPFSLVLRHALLGGCPDWEGTVPGVSCLRNRHGEPVWFRMQVQQSLDAFGKPVERKFETDDGWCRVLKQPKRGAYRKVCFDPDPVPVLIARGEYELWRAALKVLSEDLAGRLSDFDVSDTIRPACPWCAHPPGVTGVTARILPDMKNTA